MSRAMPKEGQLCFPPLIHNFKLGATGDNSTVALRASIGGRLAYERVANRENAKIEAEKRRLAADGLPADHADMIQVAAHHE